MATRRSGSAWSNIIAIPKSEVIDAILANDAESLATLKQAIAGAGTGVRSDAEQDRRFDALIGGERNGAPSRSAPAEMIGGRMRRHMLFAVALLAACGSEPPGEMTNGAAAPEPGQPDNRIECMTGSAAAFERTCSVEIAEAPHGLIFTLRKADGGFRRLLQTNDGFVAADGAEAAHVSPLQSGRIEVAIGGDRFRLPATVQRR